MRTILIGQAPFGRDCLQALLDQGEEVAGVITIPDSPGQKAPNPVKERALELGLPLLQPARLNDPGAIARVKNLRPDLLVLAFVTDYVPRAMIDLATHGGINYHPSLLPKYRGGSAMNWAIIHGERETGVTIHQIDDGLDTGPIILQEKVAIDPDDTVKSLYFGKLYPLGVKMVAAAVRLIREGKARPVPQDETRASFQPVIQEADVRIDWRQSTPKIYNLIRGANPQPGAWTTFRGEKLKIWEAGLYQARGNPGTIIAIPAGGGPVIATGDGAILALRVQYGYSREKIPADQFVAASGIQAGESMDC